MTPARDNWFDFLIIGSGTAGAVLAARLGAAPSLRVGLVEAGGPPTNPLIADPRKWPLLQGSDVDWRYRTEPQRHTAGRIHDWPRGRVLGGSTAINAMAHVRGHPRDFDAWAAAGCVGWGHADLLPYFLRSENYQPGASAWHGAGGPVHLIRPADPHPLTLAYMQAGIETGIAPTDDHNGPRMAGPTTNTLTIKDGRRQTIADAYLPGRERPAGLTVLAETEVLTLLLEDGRCRGVRVRDRDGTRDLFAESGVILAAGAIGSPTLLLRSGVGPADELAGLGIRPVCDLPPVGRNLHDHLLSGGNLYAARQPVPPSRYQNSESLMYVDRDGGTGVPELVLACVLAPVTTEQFAPPPMGSAYTIMFGFTHPRSRGRLRLAAADPATPPLIDPNYLAEAYDRDVYLAALDLAQRVGRARALDDWRDHEILPGPGCIARADRLAFLERAAFTHHHPVGTCSMGTDEHAVVGPDLKVRGVDGLYVCDASVIPRITTGPINAAIIAMAERASDLLLRRPPLAPMTL